MAESSVQEFPGYIQKPSHKPRLLMIFVFLLLLAISVLVALYLLGAKTKKLATFISSVPNQTSMPTTQATPVSTISASASPSAMLSITGKLTPTPTGKTTPTPTKSGKTPDRSKLSIAVLNGSGVPGAAGKISTQLTNLGYTVASTGNADVFTYQGLTIKVKSEESNYLPLLKKDLSSGGTSVSGSVDDTINGEAEVIVGK